MVNYAPSAIAIFLGASTAPNFVDAKYSLLRKRRIAMGDRALRLDPENLSMPLTTATMSLSLPHTDALTLNLPLDDVTQALDRIPLTTTTMSLPHTDALTLRLPLDDVIQALDRIEAQEDPSLSLPLEEAIDISALDNEGSGIPELTIVGDEGLPEGVFPLGQCEGDCDEDDDCQGALVCFPRDDYEAVPGCSGRGKFQSDYCYTPYWAIADTPEPEPEESIAFIGTTSQTTTEATTDATTTATAEGDDDTPPTAGGSGELPPFFEVGTTFTLTTDGWVETSVTPKPTNSPTDVLTSAPTPNPTDSPTDTPTQACGDGICDISRQENPANCPADCVPISFNTDEYIANAHAHGQSFTVKAAGNEITVTELAVVANKKDGKSEIKVWTTEGVGSTEEEEWTLLVNEEVELSKEGFTGIDLGTEITIPVGGEQAFYIHSKQVDIKYYEGGLRDGEEASSITDGNVEVSVMVATDEPKPFDGQLDELGVYTGGIGYYISASPLPNEPEKDE